MELLIQELENYVADLSISESPNIFEDTAVSLEAFAKILPIDRSIEKTERLESLYKKLLKHIAHLNNPELSYLVARTQKEIGFILKYKPYGIKASTPLGFSIFFLEPNEGFSFQRHLDTKTEVFHFIEPRQGRSFAFLCKYSEWEANFRTDTFSKWLADGYKAVFDHFCYRPEPGDILKIGEVGLVHSVFGYIMEEYANVSIDMVDRLYDQNQGKSIPQKFNREYFNSQLKNIRYSEENRLVSRSEEKFASKLLERSTVNGVSVLPITSTNAYSANRISIPPKGSWHLTTGDHFVSAFVSDGNARCELPRCGDEEVTGRELSLDMHDIFLSLPRCEWHIFNTSDRDLQLSVFEIDENIALQ